jgi:hypothetical protein
MNRTFDFYEYAGFIIPGAVVLMAVIWLFPEGRALFSKEGVRGISMPQIDRRPDARIVRSALDEVKAIQTLLSDVYKDLGDGRKRSSHHERSRITSLQ